MRTNFMESMKGVAPDEPVCTVVEGSPHVIKRMGHSWGEWPSRHPTRDPICDSFGEGGIGGVVAESAKAAEAVSPASARGIRGLTTPSSYSIWVHDGTATSSTALATATLPARDARPEASALPPHEAQKPRLAENKKPKVHISNSPQSKSGRFHFHLNLKLRCPTITASERRSASDLPMRLARTVGQRNTLYLFRREQLSGRL